MEGYYASTLGHFSQRCDQSHSLDIHHSRLLPHIHEQYQFRITNRLLIEKITNPRRDKVIMDSLVHASGKTILKKKKCLVSDEKTIVHRRKMMGHRKVNHEDSAVQVDSFKQQEPVTSIIHNQGIIRSQLSKWKHTKEEFRQLNQTCDIAESKYWDNVDSKMRNNFVGRIIKNNGKKQFSQTMEGSHVVHHQTSHLDINHNCQSHLSKQPLTLKRIVRRSKHNQVKCDKENNEHIDEFSIK